MKPLSTLAREISDIYADGILNKGPMHIAMTESFTGYIHSFHIRGLLAHYRGTGKGDWLKAAKVWADWSIRLQGSYGDPAAYNMGYLFETKDGIPNSWFIADTMDQAMALLNVAHLLEPSDPLYARLLESLLRFDAYIQKWNLGEQGFALGYMDGELLDQESYHCAVARGISYYSAMSLVFGAGVFQARGMTLVRHMLEHDDLSANYHGSPLTNRCYASFALSDAYYVLAAGNDALKEEIVKKMCSCIIPWAIENQTEEGYWIHDRFGDQPGATAAREKKELGPYTWGLLYGLEVFSRLLPKDDALLAVIEKCYSYMEASLVPGDINRWGHHCWGTMAIAARLYPEQIFPMRARG
jgi:hypothetical protein